MTTIPVSTELREQLERIISDYIPGTQEEAALALEEIRAELRLLLASQQDSSGAVAYRYMYLNDSIAFVHDGVAHYAPLRESQREWGITSKSHGDALIHNKQAAERDGYPSDHPMRTVVVEPLYTTPQPAGQAVEVAGEREAFEAAWDATTNSNGGVAYHVEITGNYCFSDIQQGFEMFQAGAAWQRTQSAPELGPNGSADRYFYERGYEAGKRAALAQQPNPDVARLIREEFPLFDEEGISETEHHCEWSVMQDRKRLHALLDAALAKTSGGETK